METDAQEIIAAITAQIQTYLSGEEWTGGEVLLEEGGILPEDIPAGGYVNVLDGDPGEPDEVLGGFTPCYYQHNVEIDIVVASGDPAARRSRYRKLVAAVGAALASDETLGGKAIGMQYGEPQPMQERILGGEDLRAGTIAVLVDYRTNGRIPTLNEEEEEP